MTISVDNREQVDPDFGKNGWINRPVLVIAHGVSPTVVPRHS
ncbi:MAG: hypothetical protein ACR2FE_09185 [Aeromicrobium sp.]